jgi:hypothetical protein
VASLVIDASELEHEAGGWPPPPASPAPQTSPTPSSLACLHGEQGSALVLSFTLRLWQSAWSFPCLSFI